MTAETRHTPGPWIDQQTGLILSTDGDVIADLVRLENRPLIAAAPDLLEACRAVIADGFLDRPSLNKCRAAIAKAEGR